MELSQKELKAEIEEKSLDLAAFRAARELIRARVREVIDSQNGALTPLPYWAGTDAVLGSLDLSIHAIERTIEELHQLLKQAQLAMPTLRVVKDEELS